MTSKDAFVAWSKKRQMNITPYHIFKAGYIAGKYSGEHTIIDATIKALEDELGKQEHQTLE